MDSNGDKKNKYGFVFDLIYYIVVCSLIAVCMSIIIQQQLNKNKIPHIFGYKIFMINKDYMDETLNEGDLVFTKNVEPKFLEVGNLVAFRNSQNLVTIHEIIEKKEENGKIPESVKK